MASGRSPTLWTWFLLCAQSRKEKSVKPVVLLSEDKSSYGARLFAEFKKLTGFDVLAAKCHYEAFRRLKVADRDQTIALFAGSDYAVLHRLKNQEPEDVAQFIAAESARAAKDAANASAILLLGLPFMA
jgi:hypothetical protein